MVSAVSEDHLVEFVENQDHVVVLAALQTFLDNPELLLRGLKVLLPLARPGNTSSPLFQQWFSSLVSLFRCHRGSRAAGASRETGTGSATLDARVSIRSVYWLKKTFRTFAAGANVRHR